MIFLVSLISTLSFAAGLDGLWRQDCRNGYQKEERISGGRVEFAETNFRDGFCGRPAVRILSRGALLGGPAVAQPESAEELDFIFSSVSLVPLDEGAALFYDSIRLCGLSGWRVGEEKEITGLFCSFFGEEGGLFVVPAKGTRKYGIVKRGPLEIFFGRLSPERDGSTPFRRPLELEEMAFRRVVAP